MIHAQWHYNQERNLFHIHILEDNETSFFFRMFQSRTDENMYIVLKHVKYRYTDKKGERDMWMCEMLAGVPITCNFEGSQSDALIYMRQRAGRELRSMLNGR